MSKEHNTICKLCQKAVGNEGVSPHHCVAWCKEVTQEEALKTHKQ